MDLEVGEVFKNDEGYLCQKVDAQSAVLVEGRPIRVHLNDLDEVDLDTE